ncbi:site-specific integrase [Bacterioplanoides sp. SCSIO 12839]|uniref:tyrosine-type recombinase/integrase n=1 Tax=Bacterioplanoides sp. SCSIO 12839 TaxID=2829569 RepID=UPI0021079884|nr:site-specific integrase [Bacterioplanoides sp. SCSIO 12839]
MTDDYLTFPNSKRVAEFTEHDERIRAARSETPTLEEFTEIWLNEMKVEWRDSHAISVMSNLNTYVLPVLGKIDVSAITKAQILSFRSTLAKEPKQKKEALKPATINKIMTPLRMILNEAADRYDFNSPFKGIKSLKIQRVDVEPFSLEEVRLILDNVRPDFHAYYTLRFFTGMRTGEIDGLQWRYVDFERRLILVRETVVDGRIEYTKTDGSQRDIQMSDLVYEALQAQFKVSGNQKFVFCTQACTPLSHNNVTKRVWYPLLRYLKLKKRRPYQTRHTAATLWLASGESPEWIAAQMGHTTTEMLFRVYSRYVPNLTRRDGSAIERLLNEHIGPSNKRLNQVSGINNGEDDDAS